MGEWRYYVQRANTGLWLDTDAQLTEVDLDWALSGPSSGSAYVPAGLVSTPYARDGRLTWERWGTFLFAEEDEQLAWMGICLDAVPDEKGLKIEFVGPSGWFHRLPFDDVYRTWEEDVFEVVRMLVRHSRRYEPGIEFSITQANLGFTVGDPQPPERPKEPPRRKGEKKSEWQDSKRYNEYQKDDRAWVKAYGDRERYELVWWEAPYIGEEIDSLARENNFEYRERIRWIDRREMTWEVTLQLDIDFARKREDIALVDGQNLSKPLQTKKLDEDFANHVIALGKGEGRDMRRAKAGERDGRLYQAAFVSYKSVKATDRLEKLARRDHKRMSNTNPEVDQVEVWDVLGWAATGTLRCGDVVRVVSDQADPPVDVWRRIVGITRDPVESVVALELEAP